MKIVKTVDEVRVIVKEWKKEGLFQKTIELLSVIL